MTTLTTTRRNALAPIDAARPARRDRVAACRTRGGAAAIAPEGRIARRRTAALALDPHVRALLPRLSPWPLVMQPSLTLYDAIWPATPETGACWTLTARLFGPLTHSIWSYAVTLCFDSQDRPHHFVVSGATTAVTENVCQSALAAAIAAVRRGGPLHTESPSTLPFVL
jgi:hypothetical protein